MCKDKIYKKLREDNTRNRILDGRLRPQDCDNEKVCEFLKLPKVLFKQRNQ